MAKSARGGEAELRLPWWRALSDTSRAVSEF